MPFSKYLQGSCQIITCTHSATGELGPLHSAHDVTQLFSQLLGRIFSLGKSLFVNKSLLSVKKPINTACWGIECWRTRLDSEIRVVTEQCVWRMGLGFKELLVFTKTLSSLQSELVFCSQPGHTSSKRPETFLVSLSSLFCSASLLAPTAPLWKGAVSTHPAQTVMGIPTHSKGTDVATSRGTELCWGPAPGWGGSTLKWPRFTLAYSLRYFLYLEEETYTAAPQEVAASLQEPMDFSPLMHRAYLNCSRLWSWLSNTVPSKNKGMPGWPWR